MRFLTSDTGFGEADFVASANRWAKNTDDKQRPLRVGVQVFGKTMFATDGFRMHAAPAHEVLTAQDERAFIVAEWPRGFPPTPGAVVLRDGAPTNGEVAINQAVVNSYARDFPLSHRLVAETWVNPEFLRDALRGVDVSTVRIALYENPKGRQVVNGHLEPKIHALCVSTPDRSNHPQKRWAMMKAMVMDSGEGAEKEVKGYDPFGCESGDTPPNEITTIHCASGDFQIRVDQEGNLEITNTSGVIAIEAQSSNRIILRRGSHQLTKPLAEEAGS